MSIRSEYSCPRKKFTGYSWVVVVTELVVSGTQCNLKKACTVDHIGKEQKEMDQVG